MNFYKKQHHYYCGIDLHARKMYVCIIDQRGKTRVHQNINTDPELLFDIIFPYLEDIVICVECMFSWYWVADFCAEHKIPFVLGHALYMKAIHGGKTKNDKIDSYKIAKLLKGGNLPKAYPYPAEMRATPVGPCSIWKVKSSGSLVAFYPGQVGSKELVSPQASIMQKNFC